MRFGSPEYWARYEEKNRVRKPRYASQIRAIQAKLERGTCIIKANHRVRGLNPDAHQLEVPLSERQEHRLRWNLKVLIFRLAEGYAGACAYSLPKHLSYKNPQWDGYPSWDYNSRLGNKTELD